MNELYELPDGWEWKTLEDVLFDIKTGTTPPKKEKKYYDYATINWLSPSDFAKHKELNISKNKINEIALVEKKAKVYPPDSLLLVAIGATIGKVGIIRQEASSNQQITAMKFINNVVVDFSYYWFVRIKKIIIDTASAATLPIINQKGIKSLPFPLPPLQEQKRIVSKLDTLFEKIDKAIALHQKNMDEADVFMGSVLNEVFGELEGKYGLVEVGTVTDCLVPQRNKPKQFTGNIPWITTDELQLFKRINKSTKGMGLRREDILEVKSKTIPKDSVLMSCVGDLGIVAIADAEIVVNQQLHTYQCYDVLINDFLMYALYVKRDFMYQIANITTVAYMNKSKCNSIPLPLPSLSIQQKTVKYLDQISEKTEKLKSIQKEKMESLKALKASLLDRAFRGEL